MELDTESRKISCPAVITRVHVEKIEGGLMVAGILVAAYCQILVPLFGFLFLVAGCVLTAASYRGPGEYEQPNEYAARYAGTGTSRILGPVCIVIGVLLVIVGVVLCLLKRRARRREHTIGFHCPLHGDFYPITSGLNSKNGSAQETVCSLCWSRKRGQSAVSVVPPQCPHSQISSTRSSLASSTHSQCPTPQPFLVNSGSGSGIGAHVTQISPDQLFGSIRSLTTSREVASFPLSRTPSPPVTG